MSIAQQLLLDHRMELLPGLSQQSPSKLPTVSLCDLG